MIQHEADISLVCWSSIFEMLFDVAMTILFWIEFGCISMQEFDVDFRMLDRIVSNFLAGMNASAIPNQDDAAVDVPLQVFESFNNLLATDSTFKMSFINFA